jgi:hypothetical protein
MLTGPRFYSLLLCFLIDVPSLHADTFAISNVVHPQAGQHPVVLQLATNGDYTTSEQAKYGDPAKWTVCFKAASTDANWRSASVKTVTYDSHVQLLDLHLDSATPIVTDGRDLYWTVDVGRTPGDCSQTVPAPFVWPDPNIGVLPKDQPFLRPVKPGETATMSLAGSFTAGGGTKPIYAIKEIGNIAATQHFLGHLNAPPVFRETLVPEFTSEVDINQSVSASSEPAGYRSRIDPDTISVGIALYNLTPWDHGPFYYVSTNLQVADFEFSRSDPTSAYVGGFNSKFVSKPWQNADGSKAVNADLYLGIEAGHNMNKPRMLDGVAVDLSNYSAIVRGVPGADVSFTIESSDWSSSVFSIGASYRVRLPVFDEPFVTDIHQQKAVGLGTKARNWIDFTASYNPFKWKYFSFQTEYKYGYQPPAFPLVDHSVTVGLSFTAIQPTFVTF